MTGKELIKLILDKNMLNEEIQIFGANEKGVVDLSISSSISEVGLVNDDQDNTYGGIIINRELTD